MDITKKPYFRDANLNGIDDVYDALNELENDLSKTNMRNLGNFNRAYFIITKNVRKVLDDGTFGHEDFLSKFDGRFAYYTKTLKQYLETGKTVPAWQKAFDECKKQNSSPVIYMAMGINAHVNNDIPQVLRDCGADQKHKNDYKTVNDIIEQSILEVIDSLDEGTSLLDPKRTLLKPAYKLVMQNLIKVWRFSSWQKYMKLKDGKVGVKDIEVDALRVANEIAGAPI